MIFLFHSYLLINLGKQQWVSCLVMMLDVGISPVWSEFCCVYQDCVRLVAPSRENAPDVLPQQRRKAYLHSEGNLRIK